MNKEFLYEGKAKIIYKYGRDILVHYKDDATAFNGEKKGLIENKGIINNKITAIIYKYLNKNGVSTHFIEMLNEREQLCKKVDIIPLEVIVRNTVAGSMAKRYGLVEGIKLSTPVFELSYKNDDLNDPLINDYHVLAMNLCSENELSKLYEMAKIINELLIKLFSRIGIYLVDMKFEFGKDSTGNIVLADEISPDTCRLWDVETNLKMDKDRFRRDLGNVEEVYIEILKRLEKIC
ncbi:MAG: phosphoribosylaminoimidazolesuccinocarboxamide synthase [Bacilli bacterium]